MALPPGTGKRPGDTTMKDAIVVLVVVVVAVVVCAVRPAAAVKDQKGLAIITKALTGK